jgi:hypothetical protein
MAAYIFKMDAEFAILTDRLALWSQGNDDIVVHMFYRYGERGHNIEWDDPATVVADKHRLRTLDMWQRTKDS